MTAADIYRDVMTESADRKAADSAEDRSILALDNWLSWREEYRAMGPAPHRDFDAPLGIGLSVLVGAGIWTAAIAIVWLIERVL